VHPFTSWQVVGRVSLPPTAETFLFRVWGLPTTLHGLRGRGEKKGVDIPSSPSLLLPWRHLVGRALLRLPWTCRPLKPALASVPRLRRLGRVTLLPDFRAKDLMGTFASRVYTRWTHEAPLNTVWGLGVGFRVPLFDHSPSRAVSDAFSSGGGGGGVTSKGRGRTAFFFFRVSLAIEVSPYGRNDSPQHADVLKPWPTRQSARRPVPRVAVALDEAGVGHPGGPGFRPTAPHQDVFQTPASPPSRGCLPAKCAKTSTCDPGRMKPAGGRLLADLHRPGPLCRGTAAPRGFACPWAASRRR